MRKQQVSTAELRAHEKRDAHLARVGGQTHALIGRKGDDTLLEQGVRDGSRCRAPEKWDVHTVEVEVEVGLGVVAVSVVWLYVLSSNEGAPLTKSTPKETDERSRTINATM